MALPLDKLGAKFDVGSSILSAEKAREYALATNDGNALYATGRYAPPVFGVVPTWSAMVAAVEGVVPPDAQKRIVHGERDMHFHAPLIPGMRLHSESEAHSWRVGSSSTRYTIRIISRDDSGNLVLDQYVTMFIQKENTGESAGPDKPDHGFPDAARANELCLRSCHIDADQTYRYRDASGDNMPIHIDDAFAKRVGLPGIIVHGLCTMAMNGHAVIDGLAGGDPARLKRLAVRWSKHVLPGTDLVTRIYDGGTDGDRRILAFESTSEGSLVVTNGRAEILTA